MATVEKETARLCTQILLEQFGDLPSKAGNVLLLEGRQPLGSVAKSVSTKPQRVANALLILIQHNIVWHWETSAGFETFEVNPEEVLTRLRYGRYLATTEELFGESAVAIVSFLLDEGRVRGADIVRSLVPYDQDLKARKLMETSLLTLVKEGYIKPTNPILQQPPEDRLLQYEYDATVSLRAQPGTKKGPLAAKELLEVKQIARQRMEAEIITIENSGIRKKGKESSMTSKSAKRQKTADEDAIDGDLYFRVNPDKFNIHIRNQIFVASATERFNESAGRVLQGALTAVLPTERSPYAYRSSSLGFNAISKAVPTTSSIPTSTSTTPASTSNSTTSKLSGLSLPKRLLNTADKTDDLSMKLLYVKEYVNLLCAADNPSEAGRQSAFLALTMDGGGAGGKRVSVEYEVIARRLRAAILDRTVRDKWGSAGVRIVRILRDCGKLDSEHIAKRAMLKRVDVHQYLKDMSTEGLVSSIELARSADRAASRALYLWYIDTPRTYASLLYSLHRTLANTLTRTLAEQRSVLPILLKRARTDVASNEEQYLTRAEKEALAGYERRREMANVLVGRIDEGVFLLRDMAREGFIADDGFVPQEGRA